MLIIKRHVSVKWIRPTRLRFSPLSILESSRVLTDTIAAARLHGVMLSKVMHGDGAVCTLPMIMLPKVSPKDWGATMHEVSKARFSGWG